MVLNPERIRAMQQIRQEFLSINNNPNPNIGVTVGLINEDDIFHWKVTLIGPKDTSYKGGIFILYINFPDNYPYSKPEVIFKTPIYHVNVNPNKSNMPSAEPLGHVCISTLNWWKPEYKMIEVLTNIFGLFYMANPESPYGLDRAQELQFNRPLHEEKIKYFTKKYANPGRAKIEKEYNDSWDFHYP